MAEKENKIVEVKGVSPRGIFKFPHLLEPDFGSDEHPNEDGEFNTWLVVDQAVADKFIEKLQPAMDCALEMGEEGFAKLKPAQRKKLGALSVNEIGQEVFDRETEEPTGQYEFRFKTKFSGVTFKGKPWKRSPPLLIDAKRKPLKLDAVWGGTQGKISYRAKPYFIAGQGVAGVSLYLEAAQILELVAAGQRSASDYGFEEEEGYEAEAQAGDEFSEEDGGYEGDADGSGEDEDF